MTTRNTQHVIGCVAGTKERVIKHFTIRFLKFYRVVANYLSVLLEHDSSVLTLTVTCSNNTKNIATCIRVSTTQRMSYRNTATCYQSTPEFLVRSRLSNV